MELLAASTYFQIPVYILEETSRSRKWEVLHPLGPTSNFRYPLESSDEQIMNIPDHFELLHTHGCHYDSIISSSGTHCTIRPTIQETHIHYTDTVIE